MDGPSLLRIRRFGNAAARDATYAADPTLSEQDFRTQQRALDRSLGPFSSPLAAELVRLGWDASDLVLGVPSVRAAWIREHGPLPRVPGVHDVDALLAIGEIRRLRPYVVLDGNLSVLDRHAVTFLRTHVREIRLLVGQTGTAKRFDRALDLDALLVPCPTIADAVRPWLRGSVHVLPHSFDAAILDSLPERRVRHPLVFAGALGHQYVLRHELLMALLEHTSIEAWIGLRKGVTVEGGALRGPRTTRRSALRSRALSSLPLPVLARGARRSDRLAAHLNVALASRAGGRFISVDALEDPAARFPDRCHPAVAGHDYVELIRSAGTVFHREGDDMDGCGAALRLFETTGLGATLLVDDSPMVRRLFADDEVVTYTGVEDCVEKARWLLDHPADQERIAAAGQARTLRDHTTAGRAAELAELLEGLLRRRRGADAASG